MRYNSVYIKIHIVGIIIFSLSSCGIKKSLKNRPDITGIHTIDTVRIKHNDSLFSIGRNTLLKNKYGIWELYVEGDPLERGLVNGSLTRDLMHHQEEAIMGKIETLVPSKSYRQFLSNLISWFNRKMYLYVPEEYKQEIYGISRFKREKYDYFAAPYVRALYLHGAHDIGHGLQDFMLVGCTSFAAWDTKTEDGQLLIGRNFDFYAGEDFAQQKIAAFFNPNDGNRFMMYTWGGMVGVVSGINENGITVTLNAGKSKIPTLAKTPISLVAREILQYANNTSEAIEIALKRKVFVSESIMVGSAVENKAILIEVSPNNFGVYDVPNSSQLICSNHFQSKAYSEDKRNLETIENSHSQYRFERMQELLQENNQLNPEKAAAILRNKEGLNDKNIGLGNEKSINQLLAHHGIIFKPQEKKVWVSANPYQLGAFVCYDLDNAFKKFIAGNVRTSVAEESQVIPEDPFMYSREFMEFERYRSIRNTIDHQIKNKANLQEESILKLSELNPDYWEAYKIQGDYYYENRDYETSYSKFEKALELEIATVYDRKYVEKMRRKSKRKMK